MTPIPDRPAEPPSCATDVASRILAAADRDVAVVLRLVGESQQRLVDHFHRFIEAALRAKDVDYGDHPLLRPFIETHARELAGLVHDGIGLRLRFGLRAFEQGSDPLHLLRMDLWDHLRSQIEQAERHFAASPAGLAAIIAEVASFQAGGARDGR
jgi:hypothetical protein